MNWDLLLESATLARSNAYCEYSGFAVGAAVATPSGAIFAGCNVENRTYGLTICAERVAIASAVTAGERRIAAVVVVTDTDPPSTPCGPCREMLAEFGNPETKVVLANLDGARTEYRLGDLLPYPFELPEGTEKS
jgi:cytidine deaminase